MGGRVARAVALAAVAIALAFAPGCSHGPKRGGGTWVVVQPGDTLWKLADRNGSTVDAIQHANDGVEPRSLRVGQKLWVPRARAVSSAPPRAPKGAHPPELAPDTTCGEQARKDDLSFEWPILGHLTSGYGDARATHPHDGIDLVAEEGTPIHAAEAGRVIYAGDGLGDYGRVVVVKHLGRWATVYAHNRKNLVDEGAFVERGDVIALVGETGNATTPHLHFEVRRANQPRDPQSCLP
jgi:murein DD-endopeptidase MepM/ murein hydrolase activator NlpD